MLCTYYFLGKWEGILQIHGKLYRTSMFSVHNVNDDIKGNSTLMLTFWHRYWQIEMSIYLYPVFMDTNLDSNNFDQELGDASGSKIFFTTF